MSKVKRVYVEKKQPFAVTAKELTEDIKGYLEIDALKDVIQLGDYLFPGYFEQEAARDSQETALDTFWAQFPSMENREVRLCLAKCGLTNEHITSQMRVLSGGENAKVRLAIVMNREHNWLILDEPTNHLDVDAKDELKRALTEFPGTILLVSHDPLFYEDFVTDIWNVEDWTTKIV